MNIVDKNGGIASYLSWELPGLLSMLAFMGITGLLFRSWEFAMIVTGCLGFHEAGHALALSWYGHSYRIRFGLFGAATWSRIEDRQLLSHLSNTYVHLAGPMFSLLLALAAMSVQRALGLADQHLLILANFSAQVGLLNLLPLGNYTDGGKALRRLLISAKGNHEKGSVQIVIALLFTAVIVPLIYALFNFTDRGQQVSVNGLGLLLIGAWLGAGMLIELRQGKSREPAGDKLMNRAQIAFIAILIWDMLALLMFIIVTTPFWLAPDYLVGMMANIKWALDWVVSVL